MGCILKQGGGLYTRVRIGAILLAAGKGSRLGNIAKPLMCLQGVPLINRQLIALSGSGVDEVVVVTGHYHEAIEPFVQQFPVQVVRNTNPDKGQASSLRMGFEALGKNFDVVIVSLCDQPLLSKEDFNQLISAFKKRSHGEIMIPIVDGKRGNPVLLSKIALEEIIDSSLNIICKDYINQYPERVFFYENSNQHFIFDIDCETDLEQFQSQTGYQLVLPNICLKNGYSTENEQNTENLKESFVPAYIALQNLMSNRG